MSISYNGFNSKVMTFAAGENCKVGNPVTISEDGDVVIPNINNRFIGVCTSLRNGIAGVQVEGYIEMPFTGTAPKMGVNRLTIGSHGEIVAGDNDNSEFYKILKVDVDNKIIGFIL